MRCVVFDVDDTLYLERDYVRSGFVAVGDALLEERGIAGFADAAWGRFTEGVRGKVFDAALIDLGLGHDPRLVGRLVGIYRSHRPEIALLDDAREALTRTEEARAAIAVISDGPVASQRAKVEALGLLSYASPIVLTDEWAPEFSKPHQRAFRAVMEAIGAAPEECTYVADNPAKDFIGPHALGWQTVRVRRAGSLHEHMPSGEDVDLELQDLRGWKS